MLNDSSEYSGGFVTRYPKVRQNSAATSDYGEYIDFGDNSYSGYGLYNEQELHQITEQEKIRMILLLQEDVLYLNDQQKYNYAKIDVEKYQNKIDELEEVVGNLRNRIREVLSINTTVQNENYSIKTRLGLFIKAATKFINLNKLQKELDNILEQQRNVEEFKSFFEIKSTELDKFKNELKFDEKEKYDQPF